MKVEMDATGPDGFAWDFAMNYGKLGGYAGDVAQVAESFASLIRTTAGSAASGDPTYVVTFKVTGPDLPAPHAAAGKIEGIAKGLLYSEMVALQDAGIKLLEQLNVPAHNEIKAGQRK